MFVNFYLIHLLVLLSTSNCETQKIISITPANSLYWLGSSIKITCQLTSFNIKVEECSWFIDNKRVSNGQIYQLSVHENSRECAIVVKSAATTENGEWKCRLHPSTVTQEEMSASTKVTVLDLSRREFAIIICGILGMFVMSTIITRLAVKNRRTKTFFAQRQSYLASAPTNLEMRFDGTPPPSYDTAVSGRILTDELTRLEFSRCHNEMEGSVIPSRHSSLQSCQHQGDFEPAFKTRSEPTLRFTSEC